MRLSSSQFRWIVTLLISVCLGSIAMRPARVRAPRPARTGIDCEADIEHDAQLQARAEHWSIHSLATGPDSAPVPAAVAMARTVAPGLVDLFRLPADGSYAAIPPRPLRSCLNRGPPQL